MAKSLTLTISSLNENGYGVGQKAGQTLTVARTAPGDVVQTSVPHSATRWSSADLLRVVQPLTATTTGVEPSATRRATTHHPEPDRCGVASDDPRHRCCRTAPTSDAESPDDPARAARVIRNAERGCFVMQALLRPVPITTATVLNGTALRTAT